MTWRNFLVLPNDEKCQPADRNTCLGGSIFGDFSGHADGELDRIGCTHTCVHACAHAHTSEKLPFCVSARACFGLTCELGGMDAQSLG